MSSPILSNESCNLYIDGGINFEILLETSTVLIFVEDPSSLHVNCWSKYGFLIIFIIIICNVSFILRKVNQFSH